MSNAAIISRHRVERWFYINVALFMILLNVIGFAPALLEPSGRKVALPLTPLVAAHGIVSIAFLLLFLAQTTLVATGRRDIHRRLGIAGGLLALAFVVLGCLTVIENARRGFDLSGDLSFFPPPPPGVSLESAIMSPLPGPLAFGILVGAALYWRHRPDVHKRLMLLAVISLIGTPIVHIVGHWPALQPWLFIIGIVSSAAALSVSAVYDWAVRRRIHPVSIWVPLVVFVFQTAFFPVIVPTAEWQSLTVWLLQ